MANRHQTTLGAKAKRELDFSPVVGRAPKVAKQAGGQVEMDLATFLGDPNILENPSELEPTEWNPLFSETELEGLAFLDPTTGAPANAPSDHSYPVSPTTPVTPGLNGQVENHNNSSSSSKMEDEQAWMNDQVRTLERQQQIQQQKLLELEQTLLRTEILKNRLEIVSSLKNASPSIQTQLMSALSGFPERSLPTCIPERSLPTTGLGTGVAQNLGPAHSSATTTTGQLPTCLPQSLNVAPASSSNRLNSLTGNLPTCIGGLTTASLQATTHQQFLHPCTTSGAFEQEFPEVKKKSHNLIEKKYRTSINDRIGLLRNIVSKHFKDDKKIQKSAVLQKAIDYIRYLENRNNKLANEVIQLKSLLNSLGHPVPMDITNGSSPKTSQSSPLSLSDSDEGHPSSPDVFLSDNSPNSPPLLIKHSTSSIVRTAGRTFMCFLLVLCFFFDPFALSGGQEGVVGVGHGSQRTLNWLDDAGEGAVTVEWVGMWVFRLLVASVCFGCVWVYSLPKHDPSYHGVRFWRLRKQAEQEIKKSDFSSAEIHLVSALTEIGLPYPTSYTSLMISLVWNALSHLVFQLFLGQVMVNVVSWVVCGNRGHTEKDKNPQHVGHADVAQTFHLLHQISLASYDTRSMRGSGFYLCLCALNYGEVNRHAFTNDQWAEMMFAMGVQCQYSCACIASLLARYYFMRAGDLGGMLTFINTDDGWDYLIKKEWVRDLQLSTKLYKGVAVFPKYSIARSYSKAILTEAFHDLLLSQSSQHGATGTTNGNGASVPMEECMSVFKGALEITRRVNGFLVQDLKYLTGEVPTLSDAVSTRDSGFEILMWWASIGMVASLWSTQNGSGEEYFPVIEDLEKESDPVPTALHLAFKAQRLHRSSASSPPLSVINQLCSSASLALKTCEQSMSSDDHLNLLGLLLACNWLLDLRYLVWEENQDSKKQEEVLKHQIVVGYRQDVDVLSRLTSLLPEAFPQLSKFKGYQRLISGGNPVLADTYLRTGGAEVPMLRRRASPAIKP